METLEEYPTENFERVGDIQEIEMQKNLLLGLGQDIFSEETEQALFQKLESKPDTTKLVEINKWVGYILRHGDDFVDSLGAGLLYNGNVEELENYFKSMDDLDTQQREEEFDPIEMALQSLKSINIDVAVIGFERQLTNLKGQLIN